MSSIHFVGGEKGGIGKSVFSRLLCQWFLDQSIQVAALDTDLSQGTLLRSYSKLCHPVDLFSLDSADQIMDRALGAERQVVVELASGSLKRLGRWLESGDVVNFSRDLNVKLVYWHLTNGGFESIQSLNTALSLLGPEALFIVVRNYGSGSDFSQLDGSEPLQAVLARGGHVLDLARLEPQVLKKTEAQGGNFNDARQKTEGEGALSPMQRQRLSLWLSRADKTLSSVLGSEFASPQETEAPKTEAAQAEAAKDQQTEVADAEPSSELHGDAAPEPEGTPVGTIIQEGATTWTEVGERSLTHHVRYS